MKQQNGTYQTMKAAHDNCGSVLDLLRKSEHSSRKARPASILVAQKNGLHQIREVEQSCFEEMPETYGMFCKRLACLRAADAAHRQ